MIFSPAMIDAATAEAMRMFPNGPEETSCRLSASRDFVFRIVELLSNQLEKAGKPIYIAVERDRDSEIKGLIIDCEDQTQVLPMSGSLFFARVNGHAVFLKKKTGAPHLIREVVRAVELALEDVRGAV